MSISDRVLNGLQACGAASKVNDIGASYTDVRKTLADDKVSTPLKIAKCVTEGVFIAARTGEVTQNSGDYRVKAVISSIATTADVGRKIVDAKIKPEPLGTSIKKVSLAVITGTTEVVTNLALASGNTFVAFVGTSMNISISLARIFNIL